MITGGGSFGHKLFGDHAIEAAKISKAMGKPVRLMWHRADEPRQGRVHPMATSRIRATHLAGQVLTFEQQHTSVETDFSHGLGEMLTSTSAELPAGLGNLGFAESIFQLTQELPYDFGVVTQQLVETDTRFNTGSMRNIYSPDVRCANELVIDQLARAMGKDPYKFRLEFLKDERTKAVLRKVAEVGRWGRAMAPGTAQGIAIHKEYKGSTAVLVEIDCRPATVNRKVRDAVTGPRVTRATVAVDAGLVVNPQGLKAQMMGGFSDGLALALTSSLHLAGRALPRGELGQLLLHAPVEHPAGLRRRHRRVGHRAAGRCRRGGRGLVRRCRRVRVRPGDRQGADEVPDQPRQPHRVRGQVVRAARARVAHRRPEPHLLRSPTMPKHTFILNGKATTVDVEDNVRLLWVLRDVVGLTGPKYGCGINVCKACTSHLNGKAFNPCSVRVKDIKATDKVTTIEGLADTVPGDLHPMQEAWLEYDVAQCGYCQPGQIMAAVAKVKQARAKGRSITEADLDEIRNVCRCGTYSRIREAIKAGAAKM